MLTTLIFCIVWIACGAMTYAGTLAHFQRKFPTIAADSLDGDRRFAFTMGLMGPIGLLVAAMLSRFQYGLKWW